MLYMRLSVIPEVKSWGDIFPATSQWTSPLCLGFSMCGEVWQERGSSVELFLQLLLQQNFHVFQYLENIQQTKF